MGQRFVKIFFLLALIFFVTGCNRQRAEDWDARIGEYLGVMERALQAPVSSSSQKLVVGSESKEDPKIEGKKEILTNGKSLSLEQRKKIDAWLEENNLNRYGDPLRTVYASGTPLFDLSTGKARDRYQYILDHHQDLLDYLARP